MSHKSTTATKRKLSTIAGHALNILLTVIALINILGVMFIVLRFSKYTAHQETAVATNFMPVADKYKAGQTVSVLTNAVYPKIQEQNLIVKTSIEKDYDVVIDFVNQKLAMPREVYEMIIRITNEISKAKDLSDRDLENIAKKVSTGINPVTLTNMKDCVVLRAIIGEDIYVLKRMNKMYLGGTNDSLATKFNSPYIIEILMTFTSGAEDWIVMEYVGPTIPTFHEDFTEEEIRLLLHDCFMGLDAIHKGGYYHRDLHPRNIVSIKNDKGETVRFKIIDLGKSEVKGKGRIESLELYSEIENVLAIVKDYLKHRVDTRPRDIGYMKAADLNVSTIPVHLKNTLYGHTGPHL